MQMLRDYQQSLFNKIISNFSSGIQSQMLVLPTGGGKTVLFSAIAKTYTDAGKSIMMVCHRQELIDQGANKLRQVTGVFPGIIKAGYKYEPSQVQVASIQSLKSEKRIKPPVDLLIIDEAHHASASTYAAIIDHYKKQGTHILGVTATPSRCDGEGFDHLFQTMVEETTVRSLIAEGYLSKYSIYAAFVRYQGIKFGKDYTQKDLDEVAKALQPEDLVKEYLKHNGKKAVVFACNVAHSKAIAQAYIDAGITAEHIDGNTPDKERSAILDRFRKGETGIITNCGILTEGFDCPDIELVQLARPTTSVSLYLQMVGRALRPSPGKEKAVIIDHTSNWKSHGLPDTPREWTLKAKGENKDVKECSHCSHVFVPNKNLVTSSTKITKEGDLIKLYKAHCPECGEPVFWATKLKSADSEPSEPEELEPTADNVFFKEIPPECNLDFLVLAAQQKKQNKCQLRVPNKRLNHYYLWLKAQIINNHSLSLEDIEMALNILKAGDRPNAEKLVYQVLFADIYRCTSWREIQDIMEDRPNSIKAAVWKFMLPQYKTKINQIKQQALQTA